MRPGSPDYVELQSVLHLTKGAGLAILAVLFVIGRPAGVQEICAIAPYSHPSVEKALREMASWGAKALVQRVAYRGGWLLTAHARQLSLFHVEALESTESSQLAKVLQVPGSSSSSIDGASLGEASADLPQALSPQTALNHTTTTTTRGPLAKLLQVDTRHIVQALLAMGGVGATYARKAVDAALERGEAVEAISAKVDACAAYTLTPKSRGLNRPGLWAAGLVLEGFQPPDAELMPNHEPDNGTDPNRYDSFIPYAANFQDDDRPDNDPPQEGAQDDD